MTTDPITAEDVIEAARRYLRASDRVAESGEYADGLAFYEKDKAFRDLLSRYDAQQKENPNGQ